MKSSSTTPRNSSTTSTSTSTERIGRPINCFMAFRLEKHREISSQSPKLNHREISKIIAKWWREAIDIEKAPYRAIADKAKAEHAKRYPNYKYKPVKRSERKVRPYNRREDSITREHKTKIQKQLLKEWIGEEDDNSSVASFCSSSLSSVGSSSCSVKTQSFFDDVTPIKQEPIEHKDGYFLSPSVYQPVFYDNLHYDFGTKDSTFIPACAFSSSQINAVDLATDFSSLEFFEAPDYVNLQMLSLNNSPFML